jgi:hypothetical protein
MREDKKRKDLVHPNTLEGSVWNVEANSAEQTLFSTSPAMNHSGENGLMQGVASQYAAAKQNDQVNEIPDLVGMILGEVAKYQDESSDGMYFVPLDQAHSLRRLVSRLKEIDPNSFKSAAKGKSLWRKVIQASVLPSSENYLAIFDLLEEFEGWLVQHYGVGRIHSPGRRALQFPELGRSDLEVLQAIDLHEPQPGTDISDKAGYSYDTVRRILPRLVKAGYVQKTKRGYVRLVEMCGQISNTSRPQTNSSA